MNLLQRIFGKKRKDTQPIVKRSCFSVEFYPLTKRYYPKYKNYYMMRNWQTGIIEPRESFLFVYADYSSTEEGAEKLIAEFKEQQLKENVRTIEK